MAWRDSRSSRRRLLVFSGSVVLGIAALVAVGSFGRNLENAIEEEARTLLGADLELTSRQGFTVEEETFIESLGGEQSREISFSSMIQFPGSGGTRLVQVRSLSGGFPYYGEIEAEPADAVGAFRRGEGVLVEESLLIQYGADVGDEIRIGELRTRVAGRLKKVPGETVLFATLAPRVFMSMDRLVETELLRDRSLARFKAYLRFDPEVEMRELMGSIRGELRRLGLRADTVEERQREMGRAMEHLYNFLNLIAMVALLLGGVGVASAVHVHVKQKLNTVAVLRCLGCGVGQTFAIYLIQSMALGALGATAGAWLGVGIQSLLPARGRHCVFSGRSPSCHVVPGWRDPVMEEFRRRSDWGTADPRSLCPRLAFQPCEHAGGDSVRRRRCASLGCGIRPAVDGGDEATRSDA
jgi:putative ABC transport system permease protein